MTLGQDEMETMQRLSDQYQPEVDGPLVGNKLPMSTLMSEYSQADSTYVAKTASLAATHSAYRPIKGDGQCGWRGAVFGYFETLLLIGDIQKVVQELTRLRSFDETLRMAGVDVDLISDLFDSTWEVFEKLRQAVEAQDKDENVLLNLFNDEGLSNSVIYHFKMMTSAYMQLREDDYQPFLEIPIQDYRATRIDPTNQEIDQIGLQALTDGIIAPAGIALEVSYLDRSEGDEVTPHHFVPDAPGWPNIRLLYRPGHYDMIYKDVQPVRVLTVQQQTPFHSVVGSTFDSQDMDMHSFLFPSASMHEGMGGNPVMSSQATSSTSSSMPPQQQHLLYNPDYRYQCQQYYNPALGNYADSSAGILRQQSDWLSAPPLALSGTTAASTLAPSTTVSVSIPSSSPSPLTHFPSPVPCHSRQDSEPQFRMSHAYHDFTRHKHETIPLETGTFRNSPGNECHFLSTNFQPQIWNEEEYSRP